MVALALALALVLMASTAAIAAATLGPARNQAVTRLLPPCPMDRSGRSGECLAAAVVWGPQVGQLLAEALHAHPAVHTIHLSTAGIALARGIPDETALEGHFERMGATGQRVGRDAVKTALWSAEAGLRTLLRRGAAHRLANTLVVAPCDRHWPSSTALDDMLLATVVAALGADLPQKVVVKHTDPGDGRRADDFSLTRASIRQQLASVGSRVETFELVDLNFQSLPDRSALALWRRELSRGFGGGVRLLRETFSRVREFVHVAAITVLSRTLRPDGAELDLAQYDFALLPDSRMEHFRLVVPDLASEQAPMFYRGLLASFFDSKLLSIEARSGAFSAVLYRTPRRTTEPSWLAAELRLGWETFKRPVMLVAAAALLKELVANVNHLTLAFPAGVHDTTMHKLGEWYTAHLTLREALAAAPGLRRLSLVGTTTAPHGNSTGGMWLRALVDPDALPPALGALRLQAHVSNARDAAALAAILRADQLRLVDFELSTNACVEGNVLFAGCVLENFRPLADALQKRGARDAHFQFGLAVTIRGVPESDAAPVASQIVDSLLQGLPCHTHRLRPAVVHADHSLFGFTDRVSGLADRYYPSAASLSRPDRGIRP